MSKYDELAERARQKGEFKVDASADGWVEPSAESAPEVLRKKLRSEMEQIVKQEAEAAVTPASGKKGGTMKLAKFVKFREEKFGAVLFETRQEKVYTLNPTGAAVVREIVAGTNDVLGQIKTRYQDASGKIETEVKEFLADLKDKGLLAE